MKSWITGGGGFMGIHLSNYLAEKGEEVLSTYFPPHEKEKESLLNKKAGFGECDVRDGGRVRFILKSFQPDRIYHLAAQSYPTVSWKNPKYTLETNVLGTMNIFEALKDLKTPCRVLNACSSAEYGFVKPEEVPIRETHSLKPLHPYGVSKVSQEMLAYQYFKNFGIDSVSIRIFNTTGPGKVDDVCADLTKRVVNIEKGKEKFLKVGNLESRRAITDVRDTIRGFYLAMEKASAGEVYNLSGDAVYQIKEVVEMLKKLSSSKFETEQDPALMRPTDEPIIYGDSNKFRSQTGWEQEIFLEKTLKDMLEYWRQK